MRDGQTSLKALANDNATFIAKVLILEVRAQAVEECAAQEEVAMDTLIGEAVEKFKQSEEYVAILDAEHDVGYDLGWKRSSLIYGGNTGMSTTDFLGQSS